MRQDEIERLDFLTGKNAISYVDFFIILLAYDVDFEKREGSGVVARERYECHMSQYGDLLAKAKQLKIFPLFKILTVE